MPVLRRLGHHARLYALVFIVAWLAACGGGGGGGGGGPAGPVTHTVSASAGAGGSITPSSRTVDDGETTTFTVMPDAGYSVASVSGCNGALAGTTYTTGAITADCSVSATFTSGGGATLYSVAVSAAPGAGGSVSGGGTFADGNPVTVTATPAEGYNFLTWTEGGSVVSNDASYSFTLGSDRTLVANFVIKTYAVTTSVSINGTVDPTVRIVDHGANTTLTVTPNEGYEASASGCGGSLSGTTYTTGAITGDCQVTVNFTLKSYSVSALAGMHGAISAGQTVDHGQTASFTVTPDAGYDILSVIGCGGSLSGTTYTTGPITGACTVTANFAIKTYTVDTSVGLHGSVTPTSRTVNHGATTAFTVTPDTGYQASADGCGGSLSGTTYTTGAITANCTVNVSFPPQVFPIVVTPVTNGTVTPPAPLIEYGSTASFTVTPNAGFTTSATVGGTCPAGSWSGSVWTTGTITGSCSVTFNFDQAQYTVSGTLSGLAAGESITLRLNGGSDVTLDATDNGQIYTFAATLSQGDGYTVTLVAPPAGQACVIANATGTVNGANVDADVTCVDKQVLNDTGIDWCIDASTDQSGESLLVTVAASAVDKATTCANTPYADQDGHYGRDVDARDGALTKTGGGDAGFDFTKVCNSGQLAGQGSCPADPAAGTGANELGCTLDNRTGLMWEAKVNDNASARHYGYTFSWYSDGTRSDGTTGSQNGDNAGTANGGTCLNKYDGTTNPGGDYCDTAGYVATINAQGLCGAGDWRMPKTEELRSIIDYGRQVLIDTAHFPNVQFWIDDYWSASVYGPNPSSAFRAYYGTMNAASKSVANHVLLVRDAQ